MASAGCPLSGAVTAISDVLAGKLQAVLTGISAQRCPGGEMEDTLVSEASGESCEGSSPSLGTISTTYM